MSELVLVPGFASARLGGAADATRVARQLAGLGLGVRTVRSLAWNAGRPATASLVGLGAGLALGGVLGLAGRALWTTATLTGFGGLGESYRSARASIREAAARLSGELEDASAKGRTVHVVAHSLGTEVVLRALRRLASRGVRLDGAILLVGGTASRRADWGRALTVPGGGVLNVFNPDDGWLFLDRIVRRSRTIGTAPLDDSAVTNVRTHVGHASQLDHLGRILGAAQMGRPVFAT